MQPMCAGQGQSTTAAETKALICLRVMAWPWSCCHDGRVPPLRIDTARLVIAPLTLDDVADATAATGLLMDSDDANAGWIQRWCIDQQREHAFSYFGCRERTTGDLVGFCGWRRHDLGTSLGCAISAPQRGRGLASEAAAAVVTWGIEQVGVAEIFASIRPPNPASCRVLEKAGMTRVLDYHDAQSLRWVYTLPQRAAPVVGSLSVKGVVWDTGGRVLLGLNDRGEWELPGGRPEHGETEAQCLVREVLEESGLPVSVRQHLGRWCFEVVPGQYVLISAYACLLQGSPVAMPSSEHSEVRFWDLEQLPDCALPDVYTRAIVACRAGQ